jgi:preprotein translocase subunit SecD
MMQQHWAFSGLTIVCAIAAYVQLATPVRSSDLLGKTSSITDVRLAQVRPQLPGGTRLTIQLKSTAEHPQITPADLDAVTKTIEYRLDGLGITTATIEPIGSNRLLVRLPEVSDPNQAVGVIGSTARLEFREQKVGNASKLRAALTTLTELKSERIVLQRSGNKRAIAKNQTALQRQYQEISKLFNKPTITGKNISKANSQPLSIAGWEVAIEFDKLGADTFAKMTKKMAGTGRAIGIFLDDDPISTPVVSAEFAATGITGGRAVIQGSFTAKAANYLAIQLRSGALPVPIEIVAHQKY